MHKIGLILLGLLFFTMQLSAEDPKPQLTFNALKSLSEIPLQGEDLGPILKEKLAPYHGHYVRIRGFLYKGENGQSILDGTPNLKSCCVGSEKMVTQQIFLSQTPNGPPSEHVVLLEGLFSVDPQRDFQGNITQLYHLQNATIIEGVGTSRWGLFVGVMGLCAVIFFLRKINSQKKSGKNG